MKNLNEDKEAAWPVVKSPRFKFGGRGFKSSSDYLDPGVVSRYFFNELPVYLKIGQWSVSRYL